MLANNTETTEKTVYYQKRNGRYIPVREYDSNFLDSRAYGTYVTNVVRGSRSTKYVVDADFLALEAAALELKDQLADIVLKANELRPASTPVTEHQRELWDQLLESGIGHVFVPSPYDIADQFLQVIMDKAKQMISENACVRDLQEQYQTALALVKKEEPNK